MDLVLSFDSEDYITPEAADAELWWAQTLTERGIRGSFQCVGYLIRQLHKRGRTDVLQALARHEIGTHSWLHSQQPTIPELLDGRSLSEGIEQVLRWEAPTFHALAESFGRWPISYCSPGDSWTPATLLAMASAGVKVYCNDILPPIAGHNGIPYWYCGLLTVGYSMAFESFFDCEEKSESDFITWFEAYRRSHEDGVMVLYSHPTRLVTSAFWDEPLYGGARLPMELWPPAPLHSARQVQDNKDRVCHWLDWIARQSDIRIIDFATLYFEWSHHGRPLARLLEECHLHPGQAGLLPLRQTQSNQLLPLDAFADRGYQWALYPKGFRGAHLLEQARGLAWTASLATRRP